MVASVQQAETKPERLQSKPESFWSSPSWSVINGSARLELVQPEFYVAKQLDFKLFRRSRPTDALAAVGNKGYFPISLFIITPLSG